MAGRTRSTRLFQVRRVRAALIAIDLLPWIGGQQHAYRGPHRLVELEASLYDQRSPGPVVDDAATLVNKRTKAIIPVHMRAGMDMARRHDLVVIEDAAQAMGGNVAGRRLGTIGDIGCFSLQYNKIITCGEGGIVTTNDAGLHARALMYHDVAAGMRDEAAGRPGFYGITCRMSELQGAVAGVQLRRLDEIIAACRAKRTRIVDLITDPARSKGIRLRGSHDEAGDTAIALILLCPGPQMAGVLARTLQGEGIDAEVLFDPEVADLYIALAIHPRGTDMVDSPAMVGTGRRLHLRPRTLDEHGQAPFFRRAHRHQSGPDVPTGRAGRGCAQRRPHQPVKAGATISLADLTRR